nr:FecR domain-containing protein [Pedobacter sp. ASV19]
MTKEERARILLQKYTDHTATPTERNQVEKWYAEYDKHPVQINLFAKEKIHARISARIQEEMIKETKTIRRRLPALQFVLRTAAVLVVVCGAELAFWHFSRPQVLPEKLVTVATLAGEKKDLVLPDGSQITLNPSSRLIYPAKFKSNIRLVKLAEGEAFFKISHEEKRPFTVQTSEGIYTKVLGTSFRIKSYHLSPKIEVSVATGKVAVGNSHQVFGTLVKGQQIAYDKKRQLAAISYTPQPVYINLVFEGTPLKKVFEKLAYAYSIQIDLDNPVLGNKKCTASFNTRQKPEEILDILCILHHLKFNQSDDHKTFNVYKK